MYKNHQVHGEEKEGDDGQGDPLQYNIKDDDDTKESDHHPSKKPPGGEKMQTHV